ncbi:MULTISPECIES: phage virion morphogenesis protein [unclassified Psychrobacter]|uniref:phage virion morphogenesis protein n=1 Tax=unclassified Psychrobacter TaxID=196806 RepID=UPI0018F3B5FD|nr:MULTISPECIES: phage virion morphogenesis protein [unclassified Psychrobacter]
MSVSTILITDELQRVLNQAARQTSNTAPLMRTIRAQLLSQTQQNFRMQGRPKWQALSDVTIKNYERLGISTDGLLRRSNSLYNSVQTFSDAVSATISAGGGNQSSAYAAIHQFGGMAGRGRKVKIPARPYIPIDADGNLQTEAVDGVHQVIMAHLRRSFR